jgi:hypothetical protein
MNSKTASSLCFLSALLLFVSIMLFFAVSLAAKPATSDAQLETAACDFESGKSLAIKYIPVNAGHEDAPPNGKVWMPGGSAMTLFAETPFAVGGSQVAAGAYTVYVIPGKKEWKLIVSKNESVTGAYDEKMDLARAPMEIGPLGQPEPQLRVSFGRVGPHTCEVDLDYGKTKAWAQVLER